MAEIIVVVYNISSLPRLIEFAKVAYGFGVRRLAVARVFGSAAQQIGDLFKLAFKMGGEVLVFNDLKDAHELLRPDLTLVLSRPEKGVEPLGQLPDGRIALVASGSDLPITAKELPPGARQVYAVEEDVGSLGHLAVALYLIKRVIRP